MKRSSRQAKEDERELRNNKTDNLHHTLDKFNEGRFIMELYLAYNNLA